jgi:uncharacterized BrkB/YihY/UPF0761 family membrane protein
MPDQILADAVLLIHFAIVVFVVGGLVVVVAGNRLDWNWVNNWWFRLTHLAAITIVVVQTWLGQWCPLTKLESWLRARAGGEGYTESFIAHWLRSIIFHDAPFWAFTLVYTLFALVVIAAWYYLPPKRRRHKRRNDA